MPTQTLRNLCLILSCLLLFYGWAHAQDPLATPVEKLASAKIEKAAEVLARARQLYSEEGARAALPEFEKALALFRRDADRKGEAITIGLIGNCYKRLKDYPKALDYLQRALVMKRELGDRLEEGKTLNNIGLFYWETSEYSKAFEPLNGALAIAK
ncbi:MAG: tetratricopeptide repeat protein, partial [Acidobacteriota bacterium]